MRDGNDRSRHRFDQWNRISRRAIRSSGDVTAIVIERGSDAVLCPE